MRAARVLPPAVSLAHPRAARRARAASARANATRRDFIRYGGVALTIPLWVDAFEDLGFFSGEDSDFAPLPPIEPGYDVAMFAGGCFWCMEAPFDAVRGVKATTSGYIGGDVERPRYRDVGSGSTGHVESVRVLYDASEVSYEDLLRVYWRQVDATRDDGQFVDSGAQYRPVIWATNARQMEAAEASKAALEAEHRFGDGPIKVSIVDASNMMFWPAENYHQDYYKNRPNRYRLYRSISQRDEYIARVWGIERRQ